jgi:hypothetical protein
MSCSAPLPTVTCNARQHAECAGAATNLRDSLLVLPAEEDRPGNPAGVLALKEQALGLAVLESEDLGVTADVQLAL